MKKIIYLIIISSISFSSTLPVKFEFNIGTGFNNTVITKKDLDNAGFNELFDSSFKGHKINNVVSYLALEIKAPISIQKHKLFLGIGSGPVLSSSFNKTNMNNPFNSNKQIEDKLEQLKEEKNILQIEKDNLNEEFEIIRRAIVVKNNELQYYSNLKKEATTSKSFNEKQITNLETKMASNYSDTQVQSIKDTVSESKKKLDSIKDSIESVNETITFYTLELEKSLTGTRRAEYEEIVKDKKEELTNLENAYKAQERQYNLDNYEYLKYIQTKSSLEIAKEKLSQAEKDISLADEKKPLVESDLTNLNDKRRLVADESTNKDREYEAKETELNDFVANNNNYFIEKENNETRYKVFEELNNNSNSFGGLFYGLASFNTSLKDDLYLDTSLKLGAIVLQNILYKVADNIENRNLNINNRSYTKPNDIKKINVKPFVTVSLGVLYKGFKANLVTGYNLNLFGLNLGYEF